MNVRLIWVFDYFLCSIYRYDSVNFLISYLFRPTILRYYSSKLSNFWEKLTFQIWQNYPALVGFLSELVFCRIWKKCRIPAGGGAEIWYSPNTNSPILQICSVHHSLSRDALVALIRALVSGH